MMASVFFMQPLGKCSLCDAQVSSMQRFLICHANVGQISGNLISLLVIVGTRNTEGTTDLVRSVDIMWRWIVGIGVIPGVVALAFRIAIPETPRFLLDIEDDPIKAEFDTTQLFGDLEPISIGSPMLELNDRSNSFPEPSAISPINHGFDFGFEQPASRTPASNNSSDITIFAPPNPTLNSKWTLSRADIKEYFWTEGNWRTLLCTALCWLLLDFGFYGINISNPQFLAKTWGTLHLGHESHPIWLTDDRPNASLYQMFMDTSIQALVILNIGTFAGGLALILVANRLNRVSLQKYGFLFLAALFIALGTTFVATEKVGSFAIVLYVIGQFAFNFGPNATTYILPAELFPTRYRASCHGISAATGKLGSILVQLFSAYYRFGSSSPGVGQTRRYGIVLIVFSGAMILGGILTWWGVPDVQIRERRNFKNKTLEELALGRSTGADRARRILSGADRWGGWKKRRWPGIRRG